MPIATPVETISPELALVDEQLNARGRQALCDFPHRVAAAAPSPAIPKPGRRRRPLALPGVALLIVLALASSISAGSPQTNETALVAQASPQRASEPRRLRWTSVSGAAFYNVILWRDGERVLDLWPRTSSVKLPVRRLTSGVYQWFVYPVPRADDKQRVVQLAARGTVRV